MQTVGKPARKPVIATICGDAGTGKTSLAATFPKPIFIRAEDGMRSLDQQVTAGLIAEMPDAFPVLTGDNATATLFDQMIALLKENHDYKTVVIDSVTALERIFIEEVMRIDGRAKSINQAMGGYGAGQAAVAAQHQRLRRAAGFLSDRRGMNIVFLAHADVETMRLPDSDDYMRYSLRLPSKSQPPYIDDVDIVGFVKLVSAVTGADGERKKAISTGDRELICHATVSNVSKNRMGITEPIDFVLGTNPLAHMLGVAPAKAETPAKAKARSDENFMNTSVNEAEQ